MSMKAQSAMEYLMTYGWAILIVMIVAALLIAMGVFRPATYSRKIATGFAMLGTPHDWKLPVDGDLDIVLNNNLAREITVYEINATLSGISVSYGTFNCTGDDAYMTLASGGNLNPREMCTGESNPYDINLGQLTEGTTYSLIIAIYYNAGGGVNHTERGTLNGIVGS
jgi:hypothetical protein